MLRWLPSVAIVLVVSVAATVYFAHVFGVGSAPAVVGIDPAIWWQPNWGIGVICGLVAAAIVAGLIGAWRRIWPGDSVVAIGAAVLAVTIFTFLTGFVLIGPKACIQVASDVFDSYNGGCEDPSVEVIQRGYFPDTSLEIP